MTDRALLERILSGEDGVIEVSSDTEYEWRFRSATLRARVTDNPGDPDFSIRPHRAYEYRLEIGPGGDRAIEDETDEQRVRDFVEKLLVAEGEVRADLQPAYQPYCETGYTRWTAVALVVDAAHADIQCPVCKRSGTISRTLWDALPLNVPRENAKQLTLEQHRQFFVNAP